MGKAEGSRAKPVKAERLAAAFPVAFETARGATSQKTKWPARSKAGAPGMTTIANRCRDVFRRD
jgi:hypothetical protein